MSKFVESNISKKNFVSKYEEDINFAMDIFFVKVNGQRKNKRSIHHWIRGQIVSNPSRAGSTSFGALGEIFKGGLFIIKY